MATAESRAKTIADVDNNNQKDKQKESSVYLYTKKAAKRTHSRERALSEEVMCVNGTRENEKKKQITRTYPRRAVVGRTKKKTKQKKTPTSRDANWLASS